MFTVPVGAECIGIEGAVKRKVRRSVSGACSGEQGDAPADGIQQDHFARRCAPGVVETAELTGCRHENRQTVVVAPGIDVRYLQHPFERPSNFAAVTGIIHDECAFFDPGIDGFINFRVALSARS